MTLLLCDRVDGIGSQRLALVISIFRTISPPLCLVAHLMIART